MPQTKTYTGGCHCGMVRFECTSDLAVVTACNCSICTKKGLHLAFLPPKSFQLRAGEDNLKEYLFNKHAIRHQLCIDCGVDVFARGQKPDGTEVVALNVSCIDGIELAQLAMTPANAFCGFYVAKADAKLFNKSSKVVLARDGDQTAITMASDYEASPKTSLSSFRCRLSSRKIRSAPSIRR